MKSGALLPSNAECHRPIIFITEPRSGDVTDDKFDRSMTRGKLLGNNAPLSIFISILIMTQLHPRDPEKRQQNRFMERRFLWMEQRGFIG